VQPVSHLQVRTPRGGCLHFPGDLFSCCKSILESSRVQLLTLSSTDLSCTCHMPSLAPGTGIHEPSAAVGSTSSLTVPDSTYFWAVNTGHTMDALKSSGAALTTASIQHPVFHVPGRGFCYHLKLYSSSAHLGHKDLMWQLPPFSLIT
jgi:hypothetical protein